MKRLLLLPFLILVALCVGCTAEVSDEAGDLADELGVSREAITVLPTWERENEPWVHPCNNPSEATVKLRGEHYIIDVAGPNADLYSLPVTPSTTAYTGESYPWGPTCSGPNQTGNIQLRPPHLKDLTQPNGNRLLYHGSVPDSWIAAYVAGTKTQGIGWWWARKNWN